MQENGKFNKRNAEVIRQELARLNRIKSQDGQPQGATGREEEEKDDDGDDGDGDDAGGSESVSGEGWAARDGEDSETEDAPWDNMHRLPTRIEEAN